ncbi:kunitz-type serine protease inhibitor HCRG2-like [Drosophila obscura]|uniref:kunitz-type serine protease inhibitor HCRG2-like n=1 Tax=Drosophila obscura TaxID=7282 RepID=UPI001BB125F3|nr:kunitz-type serine protease inhibitor HCRG2-like [Drosophila obscura]
MVKLMLNLVILSLIVCLTSALSTQSIVHRMKICFEPRSYGNCRNRQARWYYDQWSKTCHAFFYSGCGGNYNRFITKNACMSYCRDPQIPYDKK